MPEGPEIRRLAEALEKQIAGRVIDSIRFGLDSLKPWEPRLTGAKINKIKTYLREYFTIEGYRVVSDKGRLLIFNKLRKKGQIQLLQHVL